MAQSFTSFIYLFIASIAFSAGIGCAAPARINISFIHRQAIERLFFYSLMENNPANAQKEAQARLNEENLAKILKTKAGDLGPYQQIQLMSDTFYLDFADGFLTTMTSACAASWLFYGLLELGWRTRCRANGDFASVSIIEIPPLPNDIRATNQNNQQKTSLSLKLLREALVEELFHTVSSIFFKFKKKYQENKAKNVDSLLRSETSDEKEKKTFLKGLPRLADNREILNETKIIRKMNYGDHPKKLIQVMQWGPWIIKRLPMVWLILKYILHQHDINRGKIPKNLLINLLENLPSGLATKCREEDNFKFLLEHLIDPLWQKYSGNHQKICAELAKMGLKISAIEDSIISSDHKILDKISLSKLTMGIHAVGLPSLMSTRFGLMRKAYGHHMLKRMFISSILAFGVAGIFSIYAAFTHAHFPQEEKTYVIAPFSFFLFLTTIYSCLKSLKNFDSSQARADYQVFLKRLSLEKTQHAGSFYWGWFLPMWRINKGDIFKIEALFEKRILEVEEGYRSLTAHV